MTDLIRRLREKAGTYAHLSTFADLLTEAADQLERDADSMLGVCECGHGEGIHRFNWKGETKQFRHDCGSCACEQYRPTLQRSGRST